MKNRFIILFILLTAASLSGCSGSGGGGGGVGIINGTVVNLDYDPVSNATVTIMTNTTNSLSNGKYSFINIPSGAQIIKIAPVSNTSSYRKVTVSGGATVNADIAVVAPLDSKTTPIPASGGTATNTNGSIKIKFANGAFSTTTDIVLTAVPAVASPYSPPASQQFVSYIVYAKPEDQALGGAGGVLSVPNLTSITTEAIDFFIFNPSNLSWESFASHGHASAETNTIDVTINKLGWIAAIIPINPSPGWISGVVKDSTTLNPVPDVNVWTTTSFAVTDSFGQYTLNYIPQGSHEVRASALNYQPFTSPSKVPVISMAPTTYDFYIIPEAQGNITGIVYSNETGFGIQNAWISESGGQTAYTDLYGVYTLYNIPAGGTTVIAHASNHVISSESVTVVPGATVTKDFHLPYIGTKTSYNFSFDSTDEGFTHTGGTYLGTPVSDFWNRRYASFIESLNPQNYFNTGIYGQTQKVFLPDIGGYLPAHRNGLNGYYFWYGRATGVPATYEGSYIGFQDYSDIISTFEGTGGESDRTAFMYANPHSLMGTLESPELDLSGYLYGKLSFWTWWEIEGKNPSHDGYDKMIVLAGESPFTTYTVLGLLNPYEDPSKDIPFTGQAYSSGGYDLPGLWVKHAFDLSDYAGKKIKIRFVFDTVDTKYNGYRGWIVDDMSVEDLQYTVSSSNFRPFKISKPRN